MSVMKDSISITQFTKDNVQDGQTTLYDWQSAPPCYAGATANTGYSVYWGHSSSNTFFTNHNGVNRAYCGLFPAVKQTTAINEFGKDYAYAYWWSSYPAVLRCGGMWSYTTCAGVFYRSLHSYRGWTHSNSSWGFRAAAYGKIHLPKLRSRAKTMIHQQHQKV